MRKILPALLAFALAFPALASAASCPSLSIGSTGASVTAVQKILYDAYTNFPTPTGYFGSITQAALKQWQKEHGIEQTGTVGPKTGAAMNLCTTVSADVSIPKTSLGTSTSLTVSSRTLSRGLSGDDVVALQLFLISKNFLASGNDSGFFGALTEAAVQKFQAATGIASSGTPSTTGYGVVGPKTKMMIVAAQSSSSSTSASAGVNNVGISNSAQMTGTATTSESKAVVTPSGNSNTSSAQAGQPAAGSSGGNIVIPGADSAPSSNSTANPTASPSPASTPTPPLKPIAPTVAACSTRPSAMCADYVDLSGVNREVWLSDQTYYTVDAQIMGNSFAGYSSDVLAYVYAFDAQYRPYIAIVDMTKAALIAYVWSPVGYTVYNTYFGYTTDSSGNKYPFVAPGVHYLDNATALGNTPNPGEWNFLCVFDPAYIASPSPSCGTGFKPFLATFTTSAGATAASVSGFRHNGGWVSDVDGDGWSDISLPFFGYIMTISGQTGQQLGLAHFDPAQPEIPPAPYGFDSGRLYGAYSVMNDASGRKSVLISAANPVGSFSDLYCNVSRYFLLAAWSGASGWVPEWDTYLSFDKTLFNPPYDSVTNYSRLGDDLNGCAHRFGTSLENIQGHPYVIYDYFKKTDPAPDCQAELLEEQKSNFTNSSPYETQCVPKVLKVQGTWSTNFIDAWTGTVAKSVPGTYVWGKATNIIPNNTDLLLVQVMNSNGGVVQFDQTASALDGFSLVKLNSALSWDTIASIAHPPSAPQLSSNYTDVYGAYPIGIGQSNGDLRTLVLKDMDNDGYNDIQLQNGQWLGWSTTAGKLIIK